MMTYPSGNDNGIASTLWLHIVCKKAAAMVEDKEFPDASRGRTVFSCFCFLPARMNSQTSARENHGARRS
jgi:hypothetical protein